MPRYDKTRFSILFILIAFPLFLGSSNHKNDKNPERFNLINNTVFSPGSNVEINLYSNIEESAAFHFRLFKIENPAAFFSNLNHRTLRMNFDIWGKDRESLLKYVKSVKEWNADVIGSHYYMTRRNLTVGKINEPGIYILQAVKDKLVAYCGIVVSKYAMVYKNSGNQLLAYVADAKSGEFIKNTDFKIYKDGELIAQKNSDGDGIAFFNLKEKINPGNENVLITAETSDETVLSNPYFFGGNRRESYRAYVYTNQPVYRPGQQVHFKAIIRKDNGNNVENVPGEEFSVRIKSPKNKDVYSGNLTTNEYGSLSGNFILDDEADLGNYSIQLTKDNRTYYGSFSVEEYKKPEFEVKVKPGKNQYASHDTINAAISADYYFGSPVTTGDVIVKVYQQHFWRPWWYFSDYAWFYRSFERNGIQNYGRRELLFQQQGKLNKKGEYNFRYSIDSTVTSDNVYIIEAEVTDNSRRTINGSSNVFVTRGSFTISTSPERYFTGVGEPIKLRVNTSDFADKPIQANFKLVVDYPGENQKGGQQYYRPMSDTLYGSTDTLGRASLTFLPRLGLPGRYTYTVIAQDEKGRIITAKSSFFMGRMRNYYYRSYHNGFEIITDKNTYDKGDSLISYVFLPEGNTHVLVTLESNEILDYKKYDVQGNSFVVRTKLTGDYSPSFNLSVSYLKNKQIHTQSKLIGVLDKSKFLHIKIEPSKKEYKPGDKASYKIFVTGNDGMPVKNVDLSFGAVDESVYAIKEDNTQDIKNFFYTPKYSYIPTINSLQANYYRGSSRYLTFIDKNLTAAGESQPASGNSSLTGKVKTTRTDVNWNNIYLLLSSKSNFYKTQVDSMGKYFFKNIVNGNYAILANLDDGETIFIDSLSIAGNVEHTVDLGNYSNRFFPAPPLLLRSEARSGAQATYFMAKESVTDNAVSGYVKPALRSNFVDAAFWKADIVTNSKGVAEVSFKMPDNLTAWRATVKGATKATEVGQNTEKVITRKNLLVRLETPRFFREGDELTISTIVHNYLSEKKKVKIDFKPSGLSLEGSQINTPGYSTIVYSHNKSSYELNIDKNSELRVDWKVIVNSPLGEARIKAEALTNEESDAVELKVPIHPKGFKIVEPVVTDIENNNKIENLTFKIPDDVDLRTAKFSFAVNPSLAGTMLKALDDLVGYPYGCVEQTMSRFLPTIIVANTFKKLDAPLTDKTIKELPKMVNAGLKRLYNFQHSDGGWGWWTNDKTNPYMTAYVIYGMSLAKNAGYDLDSEIYNRGIKNLENQLKSSNLNFTTEAYMLYSLTTGLAGKDYDKASYINKVDDLLNQNLNSYALSLLVLTAKNMEQNDRSLKAVNKLIGDVHLEKSIAYWGGEAWHYSWHNDRVQSTAFAVKALVAVNKDHDLMNKAVRWLMLHKRGFSWNSTQETAAVIFGLTDYLKYTNELNPGFNAEVFINGQRMLDKKFSAADVFNNQTTITLTGLKENTLKRGINNIKIVKSGEGKLYFSGLTEFYSPKESEETSNEFRVKREYYVLEPQNEGNKIVFIKQKFNGVLTTGQILFVKTHVEAKDNDLQYFILEDMLPSGFEVIKNTGSYEIPGENDYQHTYNWGMRPWTWFYADREYRDDKVSFFVTNVRKSMDFSYMMRAEIPGDYNVMPSRGYLMYYPEVGGNSGMIKIKVKDK